MPQSILRYTVVSLTSGHLFGALDGLLNANPLARSLFDVYQPIARTSINVVAGVIIDLVYGFVLAGMFMLLSRALPGSRGLVKGLGFAGGLWFVRVVMGAACSSICGIALLISLVAVGIIKPQSQSVVPTKSSVGAEFLLKRGEDYSGVQQYDRAITDYTTAIKLKPDCAEAYNDRGFAYYLKGDFDRAIVDYTKAIEL